MDQHTTTSERIDELPVLIYWLKQMRVDVSNSRKARNPRKAAKNAGGFS